MKCNECAGETNSTLNGRCPPCAEAAHTAWQEKYHRRQPVDAVDVRKLVNLMLTQLWQHECEIITDYMPPYPRPDTQPTCVIRYGERFLRYSNGPLQGFFWDVYGDDFHSRELALIALAHCPTPQGATCVSTHGN